MKVYVFTIESEEECGASCNECLVFSTLEKAKAHFNEIKQEFFDDIGNYVDCGIIEETDTSFLWYEDGNYVYNHYLLKIQEREIL